MYDRERDEWFQYADWKYDEAKIAAAEAADKRELADWERIEQQVDEINARIIELRNQRDGLLRQDVDYAGYLDAWLDRGSGQEPMDIRSFHRHSHRLSELTESLMRAPDDEFERAWRQHAKEINRLERMLLA